MYRDARPRLLGAPTGDRRRWNPEVKPGATASVVPSCKFGDHKKNLTLAGYSSDISQGKNQSFTLTGFVGSCSAVSVFLTTGAAGGGFVGMKVTVLFS